MFEKLGRLGHGVLGFALGDADGAVIDVTMAKVTQLLETGDEIGSCAECVREGFEHEAMLARRADGPQVLGTEE